MSAEPVMDLTQKKCKPCEGGTEPMTRKEIMGSMKQLHGWEAKDGGIEKAFAFKNYYETAAFVNAVVWMAHQEDHHPDIRFGYKNCSVFYKTHSIKGLSENDFICAAKVDALLKF